MQGRWLASLTEAEKDCYLTIMLKAPSGVTRIAGAKAYAAKLAISPTIIISMPDHHSGSVRYE